MHLYLVIFAVIVVLRQLLAVMEEYLKGVLNDERLLEVARETGVILYHVAAGLKQLRGIHLGSCFSCSWSRLKQINTVDVARAQLTIADRSWEKTETYSSKPSRQAARQMLADYQLQSGSSTLSQNDKYTNSEHCTSAGLHNTNHRVAPTSGITCVSRSSTAVPSHWISQHYIA